MTDIYREMDDHQESCESPCCCCGCKLIGYLFFCKRMSKRAKIKILWGWLITLAAVSCLVLGMIIYAPDKPFATLSDMRPVKHKFNFLFCAEAEVTSPDLEFDAFRVYGDLRVNENERKLYSWDTSLYVDDLSYNFFSFYFLPGSELDVYHCSREFMTMYLFKSVDNFKTWKSDRDCEFCYISKRYITKYYQCTDKSHFQRFTIVLNSEDDYFLVYASEGDSGAFIDVSVHLNRTSYDLQNAEMVCNDAVDCKVEIDDKSQTAVYRVNDFYNLGMYNHPQFTTTCVPRIWAYLVFHGVAVLLVGIASSCLIQKFCKEPEFSARNRYNIQTNERSPLLHRPWLRPSYSTATLSAPPKYEDAVPENKDLPSYSDVMAATVNGSFVRADNIADTYGVVILTNENSSCSNARTANANITPNSIQVANENSASSQHTCSLSSNETSPNSQAEIVEDNSAITHTLVATVTSEHTRDQRVTDVTLSSPTRVATVNM